MNQQTIKKSAHISGIGLHTGKTVDLTLRPAPENTGLVFRRTDFDPIVIIPATTQQVSDTRLNTCLSHAGASVATVEHLLSALSGLWIDNVFIDLNSAEPPVLDGSALPFVKLIQSVGVLEQAAQKQFIQIKKMINL
jgi:UDP-3-O-[3-hydroxymyristoyl] N-acetylglucosamine deacetylase